MRFPKVSNHQFYLLIYRETIIKVLEESLEALLGNRSKAAFTREQKICSSGLLSMWCFSNDMNCTYCR